ncbi:MAG: S41 family peptidase [Gemmatimonadales bacterium]
MGFLTELAPKLLDPDLTMRPLLRPTLTLAVGLAVGGAIGFGAGQYRQRANASAVATAQVFNHVLNTIRADFVDSLSDAELYTKAAQGIVSTLGDPYSAFLGPADYRAYRDMLRGQGDTYGVSVQAGLTGLRIASVSPNTAAERAGLVVGDFVETIRGKPTTGWTSAEIGAALRVDSAALRLTVRAPADSVGAEVELTAESARLPAVGPTVWLSDSVAYVALRTVSDRAADELEDALDALDPDALRGLVLDLRGNTGGRLDQAIAIANTFLDPGQRIGEVARRRLRWGYEARDPARYPDLELVLLVDRRTASSAEIVAAALRDNERALLVGERTFGKGLIQTTISLGDSIGLRLTTGRWQGPGGRLIAGGLAPDSAVAPNEWETSLRRSLAGRVAAVNGVLEELARRRIKAQVVPDSIVLSRPEQDEVRARIRQAGLPLSRQTIRAHLSIFEREVARQVAVATRDPQVALRFALLADPVVTAGMAVLR